MVSNTRGGGSLTVNVLFLILFCGLTFYKFDAITAKFLQFKQNVILKNATSQRVLQTFNNDVYDDFVNDIFIVNSEYETKEILFLGNSLTYTGVPEEESDKTKRGLTSTKAENDYVHRLVKMYAERYSVNVKFSAVNIADFERRVQYK